MTKTLPEKPSELIRLAVADLEKCEVDDQYMISMSVWHNQYKKPDTEKDEFACLVCLGGSVMAKSLNVPVDEDAASYSHGFDEIVDGRGILVMNKLNALDFLRCGALDMFVERLGYDYDLSLHVTRQFDPDTDIPAVDIPFYDHDPSGFKTRMREIADAFEKLGY